MTSTEDTNSRLSAGLIVGQTVDRASRDRARAPRLEPTLAERALWRHLRTNQLGGLHFRRQQVIDGFIVDFYCHRAALAIEVDGEVHSDQREYDADRDKVLGVRGIRVLRVTNEQVMSELPSILRLILQTAETDTSYFASDSSPLPAPGRGPGG